MRIVFAGTPEIGVPSLESLAKEFNVCGVLTNPDREKGRKKILQPSAVKEKALELGIKVFQPEKLTSEFYNEIIELKPDLLVCIAYGKIFKPEFLNLFPLGGVNIHPSLLPIYRGPSPISEALLNGDKESGISIQRLAQKMDSGNILHQSKFIISDSDTTGTLTAKIAIDAAPLICDVVRNIKNNTVTEFTQDESKATFCKLIKKEDGRINWNSSSKNIINEIRAYNPWPLAQTEFGDKGLNILEATYSDIEKDGVPGLVREYSKNSGFLVNTGDGTIWITMLQLQSKKALDFKSFNNGVKDFINSVLG